MIKLRSSASAIIILLAIMGFIGGILFVGTSAGYLQNNFILQDGTLPLTDNWDVDTHNITGLDFITFSPAYISTDGSNNLIFYDDNAGLQTLSDLAKTISDVVLRDGSNSLTANWDAGSFEIRAETFESDIATGTAPFAVASTTLVSNLNADFWDGFQFSDYLDQAVRVADAVTFASVDTGFGANELYDMDQNVLTSSAVTFLTVDTGEGANELFDMDQNVLTTSDVIFGKASLTTTGVGGGLTIGGDTQLYRSASNVLYIPDSVDIHSSNAFSRPYASTLTVGRRPDGSEASLGIGYDASHYWHQSVLSNGELEWKYYNGASWVEKMHIGADGQFELPTTGSSGGLVLGGDAHIYRSDANAVGIGEGDHLKFFDEVGDKIRFYSTSYGMGVSSSDLATWSNAKFTWRDASRTGTIFMELSASADLSFPSVNSAIQIGTQSFGNLASKFENNGIRFYRRGVVYFRMGTGAEWRFIGEDSTSDYRMRLYESGSLVVYSDDAVPVSLMDLQTDGDLWLAGNLYPKTQMWFQVPDGSDRIYIGCTTTLDDALYFWDSTNGAIDVSMGSLQIAGTEVISSARNLHNIQYTQTVYQFHGASSSMPHASVRYIRSDGLATVENVCQYPVSEAGHGSTFKVIVTQNTLNGDTDFTVRKNGVDQADLEFTVSSGGTGTFSDTGDVSFAEGDLISIKATTFGSSGSIWIGGVTVMMEEI